MRLSSHLTDLDLEVLDLLDLLDVVLDRDASSLNGRSTTLILEEGDVDLVLLIVPGSLKGVLGLSLPRSSSGLTKVSVAISTEHSSNPLADAGSGSG